MRVKRPQGRPKADSNNVGRDALIAAATRLLATTPPSRINRLEIARSAGVDPALIRYYFGNKDRLLAAAMETITNEVQAATRTALRKHAGAAPSERFRAVVRAFFKVLVTHPHYHQLIVEQVVHAKSARARALRRSITQGFQQMLTELVDEGREAGEFAAVDTRLLEIALIGMCEFFSSAWPVLEEMFGPNASRRAVIERYSRFVADFAVAGISH